ncbi:ATP-binding cassette domain-containing protein [Anaerovorax odorimutans]|uniref:ATP-binding cassette domain-containing protein n=1 Tax=Anaerovorax odorimutans TaxID=109327 RepID=UPI0004227C6B|nr:ATP-binding cassette domain-containing protein [Anaerovorax odorimutans]
MSIYFKIKKKLDHFSIDIEYEFEKGVLVIQGESGAGKTTVLNCISGLLQPDDGKMVIGENTIFQRENGRAQVNIPTRKRNIAYLFQNYALFPNLTVEKNILYGIKNKAEYKDKKTRFQLMEYAEYIMQTFCISHLKKKYPKNISGGEKQRVALSRAIVTKPSLLLLDEPFSALDAETKKIVYNEFLLFKENFNIPTILITHSAKEAEMFADKRILIKEGKLKTS